MCVSAEMLSVGWRGVGGVWWGREAGGWVGGVSALPRAQEWCGQDLGSSGTWLALEFYCEPARAWHSHVSKCGRTEGREGGMEEGRRGGKDGRKSGGGARAKQKDREANIGGGEGRSVTQQRGRKQAGGRGEESRRGAGGKKAGGGQGG